MTDRDTLVAGLEKIGWSLDSKMNGHHHRMLDHKGNVSKVMLYSDHALIRDVESEVSFYYTDCELELIDNDCVSLYGKDNKSVFINFYGEGGGK